MTKTETRWNDTGQLDVLLDGTLIGTVTMSVDDLVRSWTARTPDGNEEMWRSQEHAVVSLVQIATGDLDD